MKDCTTIALDADLDTRVKGSVLLVKVCPTLATLDPKHPYTLNP